jgi:hypothetical protein
MPLLPLVCPHLFLPVIVTPHRPVHSVTRLATVYASAMHCNTPKRPSSRRSTLAGIPTRPIPPLLLQDSP